MSDYTVRIQIKEPDFHQDTRPSGESKKIRGHSTYSNVKVKADSVNQAKVKAKTKVKNSVQFRNIKANIPSLGANVNPRVSVKEVFSKVGKVLSRGGGSRAEPGDLTDPTGHIDEYTKGG